MDCAWVISEMLRKFWSESLNNRDTLDHLRVDWGGDNINADFKNVGYYNVNWVYLLWNWNHWCAFVNSVMNCCFRTRLRMS
jgi:hypothetical protein